MSWTSYLFNELVAILLNLQAKIEVIKRKHPERLKGHPLVALYVAVSDRMKEIAANPASDRYWLGNTLGKGHRDWRRAKEGLPDRYRLFFKFFSGNKEIFFAWLNDEKTLRNDSAKSDCYAVFKRMLDKGLIPSDRASLLMQSISARK